MEILVRPTKAEKPLVQRAVPPDFAPDGRPDIATLGDEGRAVGAPAR